MKWIALFFALAACQPKASPDTGPAEAAPADSRGVDSGQSAPGDSLGADSPADSPAGGADSDAEAAWPQETQLLLYLPMNLLPDENLDDALALVERAADAGYTGVVVADFKIHILHQPAFDHSRETWLAHLDALLSRAAARGMVAIPAIFPFGYSEGILYDAPDLAEGQPVEGAPFTVSTDGARLELDSAFPGLQGGDFETYSGHTPEGWDWQDEPGVRTVIDGAVAHTGAASLRIDGGHGNARIVQALSPGAHRQLHVSFWLKTEGFSTDWFNAFLYDTDLGLERSYVAFSVAPSADWTRYDFAVNTAESESLSFYIGAWSSASGALWIDDVSVEETALVNLIRRDGAPLVARGPGGAALVEGVDFDPVADPLLANFDDWHAPPEVTLPAGTSLAPGDAVALDFYAVARIDGYQVGACLTEPAVGAWMDTNLAQVTAAFPDAPALFLQYDEMRHLNTCGGCAGRGLDAGALLAEHVADAGGRVRAARPDARLMFWSDMFDPHHNAHADYYLARGDVAGSWEGLGAEDLVMNWNHGALEASLAWFAGRGHPQIVAGYYDSGDGAAAAAAERAAGEAVDGFRGLMYTTWRDDYTQLEAYAEGALGR